MRRAAEYFRRTSRVPSPDEKLCRTLDTTSQTKGFYQEKLRMQKWTVFHVISKYSLNINFLCIFFMNYGWVLRITNYRPNQTSEFDRSQRVYELWDLTFAGNVLFCLSSTFHRRKFLLIYLLLNHYTSTVCHSPPQHLSFFISYCSTTILFSHLHYQSVVLHRPLSADPRLFQTSESLKYEEIALSLLWNLQLFEHLSLTDTWGTKK